MTVAPVLRLLLCLVPLDAPLTNPCPAQIPAGPQTPADTQDPTGAAVQPESILVRRDLSVQTPVVIQAIGPDGVLLANGTHIPWFDVLVGQNWTWSTTADPQSPPPPADSPQPPTFENREIQNWQQMFGQPWFLIRSRLTRGETIEVPQLLEELSQSYVQRGTPSAGAVAVHYYQSQILAREGDSTAAALEWLAAQRSRAQLTLDDTSTPKVDWETRLQQYLNPADFPSDPILGVPFHAPPRWNHWTETDRSRWRDGLEQTLGWPQPAAPAATSTSITSATGLSPPTRQAQILVGLYGLAAAAQHQDSETLDRALELLQSVNRRLDDPTAVPQQPLLVGLIETAQRIRRVQQDPTQWNASTGFRDYLELEQAWLQSLASSDRIGLQRLTWEVYLQGLALVGHDDPAAQFAGQLHLWLLRHWAERYPETAAQIPLLQPHVWQPLLQPRTLTPPTPTR